MGDKAAAEEEEEEEEEEDPVVGEVAAEGRAAAEGNRVVEAVLAEVGNPVAAVETWVGVVAAVLLVAECRVAAAAA